MQAVRFEEGGGGRLLYEVGGTQDLVEFLGGCVVDKEALRIGPEAQSLRWLRVLVLEEVGMGWREVGKKVGCMGRWDGVE